MAAEAVFLIETRLMQTWLADVLARPRTISSGASTLLAWDGASSAQATLTRSRRRMRTSGKTENLIPTERGHR